MTSSDMATTITARNPDDLLASVPVLLGFTPTESVVMLTFGLRRGFHARIDLPRSPADQDAIIDALLEPVVRYEVPTVAFIVYAREPDLVGSLVEDLCRVFGDRGIQVLDALHATGTEWFPALPGVGEALPGVPYDDRTNPIALRALVDGHVMFASREALAASLQGDAASAQEVARHLGPTGPLDKGQIDAEVAWVLALLRRHTHDHSQPDDADTARLVTALQDLRIRDAAWCALTPDSARDLVLFWTGVVRRSPVSVLAAPATLLAFAAWLSGHGALAWCALDRCWESQADYSLARLLAQMLDRAVPPSAWGLPTTLSAGLGAGN